ncbi:hypothetical protein Y032_0071g600 [Ancylostoma ceylanicum]|uniref:Uncharacterized protein n=1 Tax=Ancylostoma ceylanicum TaxID=53326 RepID=A0A016TWA0_9BILA|nr:hypothetical protein Y032_0071g600 [Ancylostoma ceylanicum]
MHIRYPLSGIRYPVIFSLSVIRTVIRVMKNPVSAHPWYKPNNSVTVVLSASQRSLRYYKYNVISTWKTSLERGQCQIPAAVLSTCPFPTFFERLKRLSTFYLAFGPSDSIFSPTLANVILYSLAG